MTFGVRVYHFDTVGSTQDIARQKAREGDPPGTAISADFQTQGRGRQGRAWFAPPGANVCLTVIGEPVAPDEAWQLAAVAGVAVAEAVREAAPTVAARVRFPNDVYVGAKKLAGALIEVVPTPDRPDKSTPLIGIGVNVNIPAERFPPPVRELATSLLAETGKTFSVEIVQALLFERLGFLWDEWRVRGFEATLARWGALADPDARRLFVLDGAPVLCRVADLRADGTITLVLPTGETRTVAAPQVVMG